jgi:hypothetical protein
MRVLLAKSGSPIQTHRKRCRSTAGKRADVQRSTQTAMDVFTAEPVGSEAHAMIPTTQAVAFDPAQAERRETMGAAIH